MYEPQETYNPEERPIKPEVTATQFKSELAQRADLSEQEKARRFADDMPLDIILDQ